MERIEIEKRKNQEILNYTRQFDFDLRRNSDEIISLNADNLDKTKYAEIVPKTAVSVLKNQMSHEDSIDLEQSNELQLNQTSSLSSSQSRQNRPATAGKNTKESESILQGHDLIQAEQTQHLPEQLQNNFTFSRICPDCYIQNKVSFNLSYTGSVKLTVF